MTACVNKKSKRVAAVVTASLVGALSIGAPAVALADTTVDMLVAPAEDAFSRGTVSLTGTEGFNTKKGVWEATANGDGTALAVVASEVTPLGGTAIDVKSDDYKVVFTKADGTVVEKVVEPGQYTVSVECLKGAYKGSVATAKLAVKAATLNGVTAYEVDDEDASKTSDNKFIYTGGKLNVEFASSGGAGLTEGEDYTIKILKKGTDNVASAPSVEVLEAGDYVGYMTGKGQYEGETYEVKFTVDKFDFAAATLDSFDVTGTNVAPTTPVKVYVGTEGKKGYAELDPSLVKLTFATGPSGSKLFDKLGAYTFTATVDPTNANYEDPAAINSVTVNKVAAFATFKYDGAEISDAYLINKEKGEKFDLSKLKAYNGDKEAVKTVVVSQAGTSNENAAKRLANQKSGTYTVTIKADPSQNKYEVGGFKTFTVKIVTHVVDADANVFLYLKSSQQAISSIVKTYDGVAVEADHYEAKAFDKDGNPLADPTLKIEMYDAEGKKVTTAVNAGTYTLKVTSSKMELTGTTEVPVTINKVDLSELKVNKLEDWFGAAYLPIKTDKSAYRWIELDLRYNTGVADDDNNDAANDKKAWDNLGQLPVADKIQSDDNLTAEKWDAQNEEWVKVAYGDRCKTEGRWRITVSANKEVAKNYKFANDDNTTSVEFLVVDGAKRLVFRDVKPGDWYLNAVSDAEGLGYVVGVSGTPYYQPTSAIKRCDVIVILARMAGMDEELLELPEGDFYKEYGTYLDYTDVDSSAYYARALAWATKVDIAHGSNGAFRPNDTITREEFAALLSNYAMLNGKDVSVDADKVLAEFPDGSSVSDWAANAVAWAADADIMGNGGKLSPSSDITRAEVAAMAVNFQPEKIAKPVA